MWHPDFNTWSKLLKILRALVDPITFPLGMKPTNNFIERVIELVKVTSPTGHKYAMAIQINKLGKQMLPPTCWHLLKLTLIMLVT